MVAKDCSTWAVFAVVLAVYTRMQWGVAANPARPPPVTGSVMLGRAEDLTLNKVERNMICAGVGRRCHSSKQCCDPTDHCFEHPKAKFDWEFWCVPAAGFNERAEKAKTSPFGDGKYYFY